MKRVLYLLAAACAFFALPIANRYGAFASVGVLVLVGVGLALLASGYNNAISVSGGAFASLGAGVLGTTSPAAAGAVFLMLVFAERSLRVRGSAARATHVLLSLVGGGVAGTITAMYAGTSPLVYGVACATSAVVCGLPLLVEADDPVAHLLDLSAANVSEPARASLREGADLRRQAQGVPLDEDVEKSVDQTWKALVRLAEARTKIEPHARAAKMRAGALGRAAGVVSMLDKRIADHVALLSRALTAMDTAHAARLGLDDRALRDVTSASEALEMAGEAMIDVETELEEHAALSGRT